MSDNLKDVVDLAGSDDQLLLTAGGGQAGGMMLKRSEVRLLRSFADRNHFTPQEFQEASKCVMDIIVHANSKRLKLGAVNAFAALDRNNLKELDIYLNQKKALLAKDKPSTVNVNIDARNVTVEGLLDEYANIITSGDVSSQPAQNNGDGKSIYPPKANGKAS